MRPGQFDQYVEERITVLTEGERIEGLLFHIKGTRLSDFLNSSIQLESKFLKIKNATVYCRRSANAMIHVAFLMVAIDRIVMLMPNAQETIDAEST